MTAAVIVVAVGIGLEVAIGDRFVPRGRWAGPVGIWLAAIPLALAFDAALNARVPLATRYPTRWWRLAARVAGLAAIAFMIGLSGSGWLAGLNLALSTTAGSREAKVVSIGSYATGRSSTCARSLLLEIGAREHRLCADHLAGGPDAEVGRHVVLEGPASALGLHVTGLRRP